MQKIIVYETEENGARLFPAALREVVDPNQFTIESLKYDALLRLLQDDPDSVAGLVVPGRSRGQYYRDELGAKGFALLHHAASQGMAVLAVCAGSYTLSAQVDWRNTLDLSDHKKVRNATPLFMGQTRGPLPHLWADGYESATGVKISPPLAAKVVHVNFAAAENLDAAVIYCGGGAFEPHPQQPIRVLATHQDANHTAAAIEFSVGMGEVIFTNIHPEVTRESFIKKFEYNPKARANQALFGQHAEMLQAGMNGRNWLLARFVANCAKHPAAAAEMIAIGAKL